MDGELEKPPGTPGLLARKMSLPTADLSVPAIFTPMGDSTSSWNSQAPDDESFFQSRTIDLKGTVTGGNMSISPAGRDIALASRKGILIIDLDNPYEVPRFLPQGGWAEVADVQWNPHPMRAEFIVSTSSEKLLIWNLYLSGRTSIQRILHGHYRAITDVNWNNHHPDLVASCGIDSWIWTWDLRTPSKPVMGLCAWNPGATQVKWNRQDAHLLASSHDDRVLIWDNRKGSIPLAIIHAHDAKIYGIDWSRLNRDEIVTCSLDKTIKFWDTQKSAGAYKFPKDGGVSFQDAEHLDTPIVTIPTTYPVWRARHLPFGTGVLSLPHRGKTKLEMWRPDRPDAPMQRFEVEGNSVVKEYVWRTKGGNDAAFDDRDFQLITWTQDCQLRFWAIPGDVLKTAGFVHGSPIKVPVTRRGANYKSFREVSPQESPQREEPPSLSAPIGSRSILAGVRAGPPPRSTNPQPFRQATLGNPPVSPISATATSPVRPTWGKTDGLSKRDSLVAVFSTKESSPSRPVGGPESRQGFMTRGHSTGASARRATLAIDQVTWWSSFKERDSEMARWAVTRGRGREMGSDAREQSSSEDRQEQGGSGTPSSREVSAAPSMVRSMSAAGKGMSPRARGTGDKEGTPRTLADEVSSVVQKLSSVKVKVEKAELSKSGQKSCQFGLDTLSGVFVRVLFTFPDDYPLGIKANTTSRAQIDVQKSPNIPLKRRAYILRELRKIRDKKQLCIEPCLRFLLGLPDGEGGECYKKPLVLDGTESSGEEDQSKLLKDTNDDYDPAIKKNQAPRPRRSQGVFSAGGSIVYIFPTEPPRLARAHPSSSRSPAHRPGRLSFGSSPVSTKKATLQVFNPSGNLADALRGLSILARSVNTSDGKLLNEDASPPLHHLADYLPTRVETRTAPSRKGSKAVGPAWDPTPDAQSVRYLSKPMSSVGIETEAQFMDHDAFDPALAREWLISSASPDVVCARNAEIARKHGRFDYERVFITLRTLLVNIATSSGDGSTPEYQGTMWGRNPLAKSVVMHIYHDYCNRKNLQMMAMIAVLFFQADHLSLELRRSQPAPAILIQPLSHAIDYFSLRPKPSTPKDPYPIQPPSIINFSPAPWPKLPSQPSTPEITQSPTPVPAPTTTKGSWSSMLYPRLLISAAISDGSGGESASGRTRTPSGAGDILPNKGSPDSPVVAGAIPVPNGRAMMGSPKRRLRQEKSSSDSPPVTIRLSDRSSFASNGSISHIRRRTSLQQKHAPPPAMMTFPVQKLTIKAAFGGIKDDEVRPTHVPFVDSTLAPRFAGHLEAYGDMLARINLMSHRVELLRFVPPAYRTSRWAAAEDDPPLVLATVCTCSPKSVTRMTESGRCSKCRREPGAPNCTFCRRRVYGLSRTCLACTHVMHLDCWEKATPEACLTGCGCRCPKDGSFFIDSGPTIPVTPSEPPLTPLDYHPTVTFKDFPQMRRVRAQ